MSAQHAFVVGLDEHVAVGKEEGLVEAAGEQRQRSGRAERLRLDHALHPVGHVELGEVGANEVGLVVEHEQKVVAAPLGEALHDEL